MDVIGSKNLVVEVIIINIRVRNRSAPKGDLMNYKKTPPKTIDNDSRRGTKR